jgi:hypothetical protein
MFDILPQVNQGNKRDRYESDGKTDKVSSLSVRKTDVKRMKHYECVPWKTSLETQSLIKQEALGMWGA